MPSDCLTGSIWAQALGQFIGRDDDLLARMLKDVVAESSDPAVGRILDRYALEILK